MAFKAEILSAMEDPTFPTAGLKIPSSGNPTPDTRDLEDFFLGELPLAEPDDILGVLCLAPPNSLNPEEEVVGIICFFSLKSLINDHKTC